MTRPFDGLGISKGDTTSVRRAQTCGGPVPVDHRRSWRTVAVEGRSMEPTLRGGDRLLVRWGAPARPGALVVVRLPDRGLAVKRAFKRTPEGWWVERDNPREGVDSWQVGAIAEQD